MVTIVFIFLFSSILGQECKPSEFNCDKNNMRICSKEGNWEITTCPMNTECIFTSDSIACVLNLFEDSIDMLLLKKIKEGRRSDITTEALRNFKDPEYKEKNKTILSKDENSTSEDHRLQTIFEDRELLINDWQNSRKSFLKSLNTLKLSDIKQYLAAEAAYNNSSSGSSNYSSSAESSYSASGNSNYSASGNSSYSSNGTQANVSSSDNSNYSANLSKQSQAAQSSSSNMSKSQASSYNQAQNVASDKSQAASKSQAVSQCSKNSSASAQNLSAQKAQANTESSLQNKATLETKENTSMAIQNKSYQQNKAVEESKIRNDALEKARSVKDLAIKNLKEQQSIANSSTAKTEEEKADQQQAVTQAQINVDAANEIVSVEEEEAKKSNEAEQKLINQAEENVKAAQEVESAQKEESRSSAANQDRALIQAKDNYSASQMTKSDEESRLGVKIGEVPNVSIENDSASSSITSNQIPTSVDNAKYNSSTIVGSPDEPNITTTSTIHQNENLDPVNSNIQSSNASQSGRLIFTTATEIKSFKDLRDFLLKHKRGTYQKRFSKLRRNDNFVNLNEIN